MSDQRKIIHIDMDAFFASVEQRDRPELRGKPVAVGGSQDRGVVAAASYEARKFGVRSALASRTAHRLCPHIIFVKPRFEVYKQVSDQIREVFYHYTDLVEPLSLDEAFLDVTTNKMGMPSATIIANEIRQKIFEKTGLTASAGISVNKFLAKVASDINKPNGFTLIPPHEVERFIARLPINKFFGVGKVTAEKMKKMGVFVGRDLQQYSRPELVRRFGKSGGYYYHICRGEDNREVKADRIRKSVGAERTFSEDISDLSKMRIELEKIAETIERRLKSADLTGRTITLKAKTNEFEIHTRSKTIDQFVQRSEDILPVIEEHLKDSIFDEKPIRLLGISISNLNIKETKSAGGQLTLEF